MSDEKEPTARELSSLIEALLRATTRSSESDVQRVALRLIETSAGAFASGLLRGRWGGVEVGGVPVDLAAGVLLHLLGLSGVAGPRSQDLNNVAEGALATYFATWGAALGKRMRNGEQVLPVAGTAGISTERQAGEKATTNGVANVAAAASDVQLMEQIRATLAS